MSLAIEIVDEQYPLKEKNLFSYELPTPSHFNMNQGVINIPFQKKVSTASRDVSPSRGECPPEKRKPFAHVNRNDSAVDMFDIRPRVALISTSTSISEPSAEFQHHNKIGFFTLGPDGVEPVSNGASTPTADGPGYNDDDFDLRNADYFILAVSTTVFLDRTIDSSALELALDDVARYAKPGSTVILESTVPVGTTRHLLGPILRSKGLKGGISPKRPAADDYLAYQACDSFMPQSFIAGLDDIAPGSLASIHSLYTASFDHIVAVSSPEAAEMATLYESGQRMIAMAYANEMADACAPIGVDPFEICAMLSSRTSSFSAASPSAGFGFQSTKLAAVASPVDADAQVLLTHYDFPLLQHASQALSFRPAQLADDAMRTLNRRRGLPAARQPPKDISTRVLVIGAATAVGQSNTTGSPGIAIMHALEDYWYAEVQFADPLVSDEMLPDVRRLNHGNEWNETALEQFDLIIVAVRQVGLDFEVLHRLRKPLVQYCS